MIGEKETVAFRCILIRFSSQLICHVCHRIKHGIYFIWFPELNWCLSGMFFSMDLFTVSCYSDLRLAYENVVKKACARFSMPVDSRARGDWRRIRYQFLTKHGDPGITWKGAVLTTRPVRSICGTKREFVAWLCGCYDDQWLAWKRNWPAILLVGLRYTVRVFDLFNTIKSSDTVFPTDGHTSFSHGSISHRSIRGWINECRIWKCDGYLEGENPVSWSFDERTRFQLRVSAFHHLFKSL